MGANELVFFINFLIMAKAFLSHSSADKQLVNRIAKSLGNKQCILDEISFDAGRKTINEIFNGLEESDIFVLFISNTALDSPWVKNELKLAHKLLSEERLERILPIIIDDTIDYTDERIPRWLGRDYNLKVITRETIIFNKIRNALRNVSFQKSRYNQEIENIFVGRNDEMAKFERDINNLEGWMPTYIIAYNYYSGIGRRTFLMNALLKSRLIKKQSSCKLITLDSKESIESFIFKLNTISEDDDVFRADLSKKSLDEKIEMASEIVRDFMRNNEIIFIEDNGGIVQPNKKIASWFTQIIKKNDFNNNLVFCIISKFRPDENWLLREKRSLSYMIPELKKDEYQSLFIKLLRIYGHDSIPTEDKKFFLDHLKGIPAQIIFAVQMIDINPYEAKNGIHEIEEFSDQFSRILLEKLRDDETAYQIAILLSQNEIFSITLINKVFGDNDATKSAMQLLFDLSLLTFLFGNYEYVSLNKSLADYIGRSRIQLDSKYKVRFAQELRTLLRKDLDNVLVSDYSAFMLTLQNLLREGKKIPTKYFIPSLLLKNVIMLYNQGQYKQVITICDSLLSETNYDSQIVWETRYWQTQALAKSKDSRALENLIYFQENSIAENFLKGFYYRNIGEKNKALESFYRVLKKDKNHARTKREIVNILLSQEKYNEALEMAEDNYNKEKTNIYHIQSYFICLIRRNEYLVPEDIRTLKGLIHNMESSVAAKAADMLRCMTGEYAYYVENDYEKAKRTLLDAINRNENKSFPKKSLREISRAAKRMNEYRSLGLDDVPEDVDMFEFD